MITLRPTAPARLSARSVLVRYVSFAVIAGIANLAAQQAAVSAVPNAPVMYSILTGTALGFVVKYVLDKKWVFLDTYDSHVAEARKVALYGAFSIATTLLFWAVELGFWTAFGTSTAKYIGAVIGLAVGNWVKYLLDRSYVFRTGRL